ncbi:hypothetical protein GWI33_005084 [Rhynchophorus ferrugineus]|uniref:Cyclin-dependent kinase inhibitor domain-containing protein n=1 Tax=Rhynchophorus ferrugineus TaxID=354439 RepID=A0A834IHA4_RHYFE|nr:hypothetical protein GWI33_005084 [Rhynchophorus ferrugineus]
MSTRVYSSISLLMPRNQNLPGFNEPQRKVKRVLFGPVDPQATQKFIEEEFKKIKTTQSEVWNFDFEKGTILHADGAYDWRPATPNKQIRLIKRKEDTDVDNSDQYCNLSEIKIVRPQARIISCSNTRSAKIQQRRITDFAAKLIESLTKIKLLA